MQWLIDIIAERVLERFENIISQWHGLLVDIPDGWVLCDGTNGTPDMRNMFVKGPADGKDPGDTGGAPNHTHPFVSNTHDHDIELNMTADGVTEGEELAGTENGPISTETSVVSGTTESSKHEPEFYELAFIMKT